MYWGTVGNHARAVIFSSSGTDLLAIGTITAIGVDGAWCDFPISFTFEPSTTYLFGFVLESGWWAAATNIGTTGTERDNALLYPDSGEPFSSDYHQDPTLSLYVTYIESAGEVGAWIRF
jgi:hypothetical protein